MNYRKLFSILLSFTIILQYLCGCDVDIYDGKRPMDQPNTQWECYEHCIQFTVTEDGFCEGTMTVEGEEVRFYLLWDSFSTGVHFIENHEGMYDYQYDLSFELFSGSCKFSKKNLVVSVKNTNIAWNIDEDEMPLLEFVRVDM